MSKIDLTAIEARAAKAKAVTATAMVGHRVVDACVADSAHDVPDLVAEIKRLHEAFAGIEKLVFDVAGQMGKDLAESDGEEAAHIAEALGMRIMLEVRKVAGSEQDAALTRLRSLAWGLIEKLSSCDIPGCRAVAICRRYADDAEFCAKHAEGLSDSSALYFYYVDALRALTSELEGT